jgi:hypothetical protein
MLARGGGSTWAGLAPAYDLANGDGADPLAAPRAWFAFLPGVSPDRLDLGPRALTVAVGGGTAVRTGTLSLEQARAALREVVPGGADVTLYPVID